MLFILTPVNAMKSVYYIHTHIHIHILLYRGSVRLPRKVAFFKSGRRV